MKNLNKLTVLIVTYKTNKKVLLDCIKSIDKKINILIVENSKNFEYSKETKKFKNLKYICSKKNLGYGNGNNFGLKQIKTKYVLILNPDTICGKNFFKNISDLIKNNLDFHIIGSQYPNYINLPAGYFDHKKNDTFKDNFKNRKLDYLTKVDWVVGFSMLINLSKFKNKKIFDSNFFLFFEETDLCMRVIKKEGKIFTCSGLRVHHLWGKGSLRENDKEKMDLKLLREWHNMWSSYYFYKKHKGHIAALNKHFIIFLGALVKIIYFNITFNKKKRDRYKYRLLGLLNSILNKPSFLRK